MPITIELVWLWIFLLLFLDRFLLEFAVYLLKATKTCSLLLLMNRLLLEMQSTEWIWAIENEICSDRKKERRLNVKETRDEKHLKAIDCKPKWIEPMWKIQCKLIYLYVWSFKWSNESRKLIEGIKTTLSRIQNIYLFEKERKRITHKLKVIIVIIVSRCVMCNSWKADTIKSQLIATHRGIHFDPLNKIQHTQQERWRKKMHEVNECTDSMRNQIY